MVDESPAKRRSFQWSSFDTFRLPVDSASAELDVRTAARQWASASGMVIGSFSSPRYIFGRDSMVTVGRCMKCSGCHEGKGSAFQFIRSCNDDTWTIQISKAGECTQDARAVRKKSTMEGGGLTVEQRSQLLKLVEELMERGEHPSPARLRVLLGPTFAVEHIRRWWRHYVVSSGRGTKRWKESHASVVEFIESELPKEYLHVWHLQQSPFNYVCVLPAMLQKLKELAPQVPRPKHRLQKLVAFFILAIWKKGQFFGYA